MSSLAPEHDLYAILEIPVSADASEIKNSYRRLVRINHPDANPERRVECENRMKSIIEAYAILSDPQKRERYDSEARLRAFHSFKREGKIPGKKADISSEEPPSLMGKVRFALNVTPRDFAALLGLGDAILSDYEQRDTIPQSPVQFRTFIALCNRAIAQLESDNEYERAQAIRVSLERKRNQRFHYR